MKWYYFDKQTEAPPITTETAATLRSLASARLGLKAGNMQAGTQTDGTSTSRAHRPNKEPP